jgi:hypothetical protein
VVAMLIHIVEYVGLGLVLLLAVLFDRGWAD